MWLTSDPTTAPLDQIGFVQSMHIFDAGAAGAGRDMPLDTFEYDDHEPGTAVRAVTKPFRILPANIVVDMPFGEKMELTLGHAATRACDDCDILGSKPTPKSATHWPGCCPSRRVVLTCCSSPFPFSSRLQRIPVSSCDVLSGLLVKVRPAEQAQSALVIHHLAPPRSSHVSHVRQ